MAGNGFDTFLNLGGFKPVQGTTPYGGRATSLQPDASNPFFNSIYQNLKTVANRAGATPFGSNFDDALAALTQMPNKPSSSTGSGGSGASTGPSFDWQSSYGRKGSGSSSEETAPTGPKPFSIDWFFQQAANNKQASLDAITQGMGGITGGVDQYLQDAIRRLAEVEAAQTTELGTQIGEGRSAIDEATARAMQALTAQGNPYANLEMVNAPSVVNPLASYMGQSGASSEAVNQLANMLNASNAASTGAFQNLKNLMSASNTAATQSRAGDVELARAAAMRDLEANRRALSYGISQGRIGGELQQRAAANEIKRNAEMSALQQRLGVNQQYGTESQQLYTTLLSMLFQDRNLSKSGALIPLLGLQLTEKGLVKPR